MMASARIAAHFREQIRSGALRPGERLPPVRELARRWRVALATASRAIAVLKQEGLVRAEPRVGTIVAARSRARTDPELTPESIVRAAITIADVEGLDAVSMRSVAGALGAPAMSLYRHVPSKDELLLAMIDACFAELPEHAPSGAWRADLGAAMRAQWKLHRAHPWLVRALSITRPQMLPNGMRFAESVLRPLDGLGLDPGEMMRTYLVLMSFVRGVAIGVDAELEAEATSGMTNDEWIAQREPSFAAALEGSSYPTLARMIAAPRLDVELDAVFELGLARLLDGIDAMLRAPSRVMLAPVMGSRGRPYRTFVIDGIEVLVGRADEDNDHLTFHVAKKRDLWLHVGGGTPGSHVVVRSPERGDPPDAVVERAAQLAAWYSKARGAPRVEVHVCRVSDVSKPKGAPAGKVEIKRFSKRKVTPTRGDAEGDD
ncbi:Fibronectin/fibrinogen-binding protein [Sandaracinus amylolyticus]|uniref:Fibronectin/fibrinogen-binding protein n=2 Tax=Sandaracinus amylolyticus TaxID=927083 RepID=A0A0F6WAD9_9BACT|nr:Fibronectin/fibrinogen-binding protein [Sandaracinus amylolyticus]